MGAISKIKETKYDYNFCSMDIKRYLIEKFLYDNDSESINILLNMYDVDNSIETICPTYISLKHLKKDIIKFLKHKEGKELIAYNLSNLIHNDVNRFELFLYLEGYRAGSNAVKNINKLEIITFKNYNIEDLYYRRTLFNYEVKDNEVLKLKENMLKDLKRDSKVRRTIYDIVFKFNLHLLKRKVFNLNAHVDKQLVLNFDITDESDVKFKETNSHLSKKELYGLDRKIVRFLCIDAMRIYENAYWEGVNDKVLKRYK
ncbi:MULTISPECIES: hypothetical protein [Peptoniphilus]|uniref:hypothetical protein n=1 Tax=Peptoniphilus TaxID=162289 RepID=UPI0001DA9C7B|nr:MULTISPECIES: hypothetical protein [Peptoniphilus]EFI42237.1 hypothetical protein HMPREF0629_00881 [Peptoniphilus sp. oral taxon 386 str. F0131]